MFSLNLSNSVTISNFVNHLTNGVSAFKFNLLIVTTSLCNLAFDEGQRTRRPNDKLAFGGWTYRWALHRVREYRRRAHYHGYTHRIFYVELYQCCCHCLDCQPRPGSKHEQQYEELKHGNLQDSLQSDALSDLPVKVLPPCSMLHNH